MFLPGKSSWRWLPRVVGCFCFSWLALICSAPLAAQALPASETVPHELLVRFKPQASAAQRASVLNTHRAQTIRHFKTVDIHHLRLPETANVNQIVQLLRANPQVASAQPNYIRHVVASAPPNDPDWLNDSLWGLQRIQMQPVWLQYTTGSTSVVVADIDTGVDYYHPDLVANLWHNPGEIAGNGIDDDGNGYIDDIYGIDTYNHDSDPYDDYGHGTHTAGTIAAAGNNGIGVTGVNWNSQLIACKFIGKDGSGSDAGAIECFDYLIALKNRGVNVRVTNNSWGGTRGSDPFPQALKDAIDAAGNVGILNIFAAGNDASNIDAAPFDPASFDSPSIISVGASDENDQRSSFSNYGLVSVDLAAPGSDILSTQYGDYHYSSGTSMATPHVAGAVAILAAWRPALSSDQIKRLIMENADPVSGWSALSVTGGRLNVLNAVIAADLLVPVSVSHDTTQVVCTLTSAVGYSYQLQRSSDQKTWQSIGVSQPGSGGGLNFSDQFTNAGASAFYRVLASHSSN